MNVAKHPNLTQEMVDKAIHLKADGLSNGDIISALGIHESTFCRWLDGPKNGLQRTPSEGLKGKQCSKLTLLTTTRSTARKGFSRTRLQDEPGMTSKPM